MNEQTWQPMTKTPRDGDWVIVHAPEAMNVDFWPAMWIEETRSFNAGWGWFEADEITHWMPLPQPPKETA